MSDNFTNDNNDEREIAKFAAHSSEWWDKSGAYKTLHQFNECRKKIIADKLYEYFFGKKPLNASDISFKGKSLIDVGCGGGLMSEPMFKMGFDVTAIDILAENIRIAKENTSPEIRYLNTPMQDIIKSDEKFDVVMCLEVLEHVSDYKQYLCSLARLLKPEGILIISTVNKNILSFLLAKVAAEYILRWVPTGMHEWKKFISPSEIKETLQSSEANKLHLTHLFDKGIFYNPLRNKWVCVNNTSVNYISFFRNDSPH